MKANKQLAKFKHIDLEIIDNILYAKYNTCKIDLEQAKKIIKDRLEYTEGNSYLAIITSSGITEITKEARVFFSTKKGTNGLSAIALVHEDSKLNQVVMNFALKLYPPTIPIKTFKKKEKALFWLQNFNQT